MSLTKMVPVVKFDQERQMAFGFFNVCLECDGSQVIDSQNDSIAVEELETAAYLFNMEYRELNERHQGLPTGTLVESIFVTKEKISSMIPSTHPGRDELIEAFMKAVPEGSWWGGFHVRDEEAWKKVKKGEYRMFSIEGTAIREEDE